MFNKDLDKDKSINSLKLRLNQTELYKDNKGIDLLIAALEKSDAPIYKIDALATVEISRMGPFPKILHYAEQAVGNPEAIKKFNNGVNKILNSLEANDLKTGTYVDSTLLMATSGKSDQHINSKLDTFRELNKSAILR